MATRIIPLDSVTISGAAGQYVIPSTTITSFTESYSAPMYLNVYNSGSSGAYLQLSGSSNPTDGRYIASGASAQYGPIAFADGFPVVRLDAAGGCVVSFDVLKSEG